MVSSNVSWPKPSFTATLKSEEPETIQDLITKLNLQPNIEGGYFVETDRATDTVLSPFPHKESNTRDLVPQRPGFNSSIRNTSTTIFYLLTPTTPQGGFHRNAGRTVHTLHRGRGVYILIHADEPGFPKRIETFKVGQDITGGEKLQWIVEGGKYKATFLLPDFDGEGDGNGDIVSESGLLISETVIPGFEYCDHDFLSAAGLEELVGVEKAAELEWLLSPLGRKA